MKAVVDPGTTLARCSAALGRSRNAGDPHMIGRVEKGKGQQRAARSYWGEECTVAQALIFGTRRMLTHQHRNLRLLAASGFSKEVEAISQL